MAIRFYIRLLLASLRDLLLKSIIFFVWLIGEMWMAAFLSHAPSFPATNIAVHQYLSQVIAYGALPSFVLLILLRAHHLRPMAQLLGYHPFELYNPLSDPSVAPSERGKVFLTWVSRYYAHGHIMISNGLHDSWASRHRVAEQKTSEHRKLRLVQKSSPNSLH